MARRILIIEDDPMNAKLFQIVLTRKGGFQVEVTEDPPYVLREARAGSVDLIIMDISLSNSELDGKPVDGLEITRRLKANPGTRHVPVLLATAHAMKGSREKFLRESGADDYISKPIIDSDDLIQRVESLIAKGSHAVPPVDR
ncbi:MAG TPA: response regulator [Thermoplasmata archaeon]|nr:response regulator [Thermoplasmata archaeon]